MKPKHIVLVIALAAVANFFGAVAADYYIRTRR